MHILAGEGKKKIKTTGEVALYTGTQVIPTLKSVQKSPGSFSFGQLEILLSNENAVHGLFRGNSHIKTSRYSAQSCYVWYLIQIIN